MGHPTGPAAIFQIGFKYQQCGGTQASSPHTGGINAAMGDGSVHFVAQGVSPNTWWYAFTPNGGDILGSDW
jgi:prepilin-type processing-associated H-X9-DG protein